MKTLGYAVILLLCFAIPAHAAQVYSGCAAPPSTFRHVWYFDPVHGKTQAAGGNGSQATPWNNLQALVQAEPGYSFPLLTTAPYRQVPVPGQPAVTKTGPNAGPIAPGDEILLMSGNYGDVWHQRFERAAISNSDFVTVAAAPGQTPVLTSLFVGETNKWVFSGLKVQSLQPAARSGNALVAVKDGARRFRHPTLCFENMTHLVPGQRQGLEQSPMGRECAQRVLGHEQPPAARIRSAFRSPGRISAMSGSALRLRPTNSSSQTTRSIILATTELITRQAISPSPRTISMTTWTSATAIMKTPCRA